MKRFITLLLVFALCLSMISCGDAKEKTIVIEPHQDALYVDDEIVMEATVKYDGELKSDATVIWTSSDPSIAEVKEDGTVCGLNAGSAKIIACLTDDESVCAETEITIGNHVSSVAFEEESVTLLTGSEKDSAKLNVVITPSDALCQDVEFKSSDSAVVSVESDGTVRAVAPGTAVISVSSLDDTCSVTSSCEVSVKTGVSSIELSESATDLYIGDTLSLTYSIVPEDAGDKTVIWKSDDESIATVNDAGVITPVAQGSTVITCAALDGSEVKAECKVNVVKGVSQLTMNEKEIVLLVGASEDLNKKQLEYTVLPEDASYKTVTWSSSDENIVKVNEDGVVEGVAKGKATITAVTNDPRFSNKINAKCTVVVGNAVQKITIDEEANISKGTKKKISYTISPESVYNSKLEWKTSNENVMEVDANGNIRAVGTGTAEISCVATDGSGVKTSKSFTVYQPVTSVKAVERGTNVIFEGETIKLHTEVGPSDATDKAVTWSSDNNWMASVDQNGTVTAKNRGSTNIVATAKDGSGKKCNFKVVVEPAVPVTVDSLGFGIYNANLLGITVKNTCATKSIKNFHFNIELYSYDGSKLNSSGSYSLGDDVYISAGSTSTIKRTLSGVAWAQKIKITITSVEFTDKTRYDIPWLEQETWSFSR